MKKSEEIKLMIIENFIDHFTSNEEEREKMKATAKAYVDEDHVNEIEQSELFQEEEDEEIKAVSRAANLLSNDYLEIPSILERLSELEDQSVMLEGSVDDIIVWEKVAHSFTVSQFLEEIGY